MSFRGKLWVLVISGAIAVYAVVGGLPFVGSVLTTQAQQPVNDPAAQLRIVDAVLQHIQNDYVDEPNMDKVRLGALRGLATGLDPYSAFLTPDQARDYQDRKDAAKTGIGAEFSQVSGFLYVLDATKGSPADKAGIKMGDIIEYVDNKATRDISLYDAEQLVRGDPGSTVALRVLRSGEKPQTIKVVRSTYKVPAAESHIEGGKIGVIKVYSLEDGEANDIRNQVASLMKQGVQKIVLDLRGVAAGNLSEGAAVANLFIKDGDLAKIVGRENKVVKTFTADPSKTIFDGGLVALIDLGTAGASEAVAAAILDHKRGDVVGERSFGVGTEQAFYPMSSGGGFLLTVSRWASPSGVPFFGDDRTTMGIKPSVEVKRPDTPEPLDIDDIVDQDKQKDPSATPTPTPKPKPAAAVDDVQLKKAIELLSDKASAANAGE